MNLPGSKKITQAYDGVRQTIPLQWRKPPPLVKMLLDLQGDSQNIRNESICFLFFHVANLRDD